ncbi:hypothetical protein [Salinispora cortesiana]|uniref:hypothetical protein n=1 Tax=Salinispora cortesiana TaxID=1305843 RepID=UPI001FDFEBFB|nr:hypothetical protein [Salinispora cortesiana]
MNYPSHPHRRPPVPLVARVANAATAAYQRAMTNKRERLYQQEIERLRKENAWLRNEVRHCRDAIDVMGHDLESRRREFVLGELLARADTRRQTAVVDQRRLLEVHLREQLAAEAEETVRATYAEGYADGIMRRRADGQG